jgi:hypothetical protein
MIKMRNVRDYNRQELFQSLDALKIYCVEEGLWLSFDRGESEESSEPSGALIDDAGNIRGAFIPTRCTAYASMSVSHPIAVMWALYREEQKAD